MATPAAIISTNASGEPEVGPEIPTILKGATTNKRRVVLGWNHQTDTPNGLRSGKVWCWVTEHDHLMVFDENFNRSAIPGQIRFCGVANFTMVRMFHPYWAHFGHAPRDMHFRDKRRCRAQYRQLIRRWRIRNNLPVDDDPDNPIQPDTEPEGNRRKRRGRPARRSRGGRVPGPGHRRRRQERPVVPGREEQIPGSAVTEPMTISDDGDSDWNDDIPLVQRSRPGNARPRQGSMSNVITSIFGNSKVPFLGAGEEVHEVAEEEVKDEDETRQTVDTNNTGARVRSIFTPPLNASLNETIQITGAQRLSQTTEETAPALTQMDDDDSHFDALRSAIAETWNDSIDEGTTQETMQEFTQNTIESGDSLRELGGAATMLEREAEVKSDEDEVVSWVPCPITPVGEVIVIEE